jgi:hypothetical protein
VRRLAVVVAAAGASLALTVSPAGATNECRGLQVCVPVAGPWVVVPTARGATRRTVEFQLTCPRGYIVGGLDAEVSRRGVAVSFTGRLGSPVNPGITTSRAAVFAASYVARPPLRAASFRPHIGCMPAAGGGRRVPTSRGAVAPGEPTVRRVKTVRVGPGARRVTQTCAAGERLVGAAHAVGFFTKAPPDAPLATSVRTSRSVNARRVSVAVRAAPAAAEIRSVVQVSAICSGAR